MDLKESIELNFQIFACSCWFVCLNTICPAKESRKHFILYVCSVF